MSIPLPRSISLRLSRLRERTENSTRYVGASVSFLLLVAAGFSLAGCSDGQGDWEDEQIATSQWAVHRVCGVSGHKTLGIDISKWQGDIDWARVASDGVVFGIARVSYGSGYRDKYFAKNWAGMKKNGIIRGAYQYYRPSQDPIAQAKLFIQMVEQNGGWKDGDLPPVLDIEETEGVSKSKLVSDLGKWLAYMETHSNRRPIIYTGSYFWDGHVGNHYSKYPLWGANYTTNKCPLIADNWDHWLIWQYSSKGSVKGISGNVDMDWYDGTKSSLLKFAADSVLGAKPEPQPQPDSGPDVREPDTGPPPQEAGTVDVRDEPTFDAGVDAQQQDAAVWDSAPYIDSDANADQQPIPTNSHWANESSDGCACSVPGTQRSSHAPWAWFGLGAATLLMFRRRRH